MTYQIEVNLIPGLPQEAYEQGTKGVVAHSTANNGDYDDGERSYESRTWQNAFVHFFVDDSKIEQVADAKYLCYGAGHTANHLGYVQVELCQTTDSAKFLEAYSKYVWLLAKILYDNHLPVIDGETLMSHAEVSAKWHETDHTDPIAYLESHGKTWSDVIADVTHEYNTMNAPATQLKPVAQPISQPLYRVRLSASDVKSQIGAYHILRSAETAADTHQGYSVFDGNGKLVYTPPVAKATPAPVPQPQLTKPFVGTSIMGKSVATVNQLNDFIRSKNPNALLLADIYAKMESIYCVRADIAFCQMCKETKFQMFGGDVKQEQHNPAGLGATGGVAGASFKTWEDGIEAQFQHLYAYACDKELPAGRPLLDERFKYVHRGDAPWVEWLGINENPNHVGWATDANYGISILNDYLDLAVKCPDVPVVEPQSQPEQPAQQVPQQNSAQSEAPQAKQSWWASLVETIIAFLKGGN